MINQTFIKKSNILSSVLMNQNINHEWSKVKILLVPW
jgi:hypothetical protein